MPEEYLYLVDENNKVIGKVLRSEVRKKNLPHRGIKVFVFNSKGEILITKRTKTKDIYPGLFEVSQGGAVAYGESYEETAKREIEEEAGIRNPKLEFIFDCHWKNEKKDSFEKVYKCVYDGEIKPQKEEIDDYFFISIKKLDEMIKKNPDKFVPDSVLAFRKLLEHGGVINC